MAEHNGNGKMMATIIWSVVWTLLLGSYAWSTYACHTITKEVIINDRENIDEHKDIREKVYTELSTMNKSLSYMRACFDNMQKKMN